MPANAARPNDNDSKPAPIKAMPKPNNANAPPTAYRSFVNPCNSSTAPTTIAKTAASPINPCIMSPSDMLPIITKAFARTVIPAAKNIKPTPA